MVIVIVRDNIVENIGTPPLGDNPPEGAHEFDGFVSIGWLWNDGNPVDPNPPLPEAPAVPLSPEQKLAQIGLTPDDLAAMIKKVM